MADPQNRFEDRNQRVALNIPVELGQGDFEDAFEASTVNLSKGGLSMRSACLPDPGTRLSCRFRALPSGTMLTAQGEVVWAHLDGAESGEFGLSFVELDPKTEWLIEEMLAEQARLEGPRPDGEVAAAVAQLELEGSSGAISARVARKDGRNVVFEQTLDVLSVGRGVLAHAEGRTGKQGSITGVELRMVGNVPMLAVTVAFDQSGSSVGFVPAPEEAEAEHDTAPDLRAPTKATLVEFEAEQAARVPAFASLRAPALAPATEPEPTPEAFEQESVDEHDASSLDAQASALVHELPTANPALEAPDAAMFASPLGSKPDPEPQARQPQSQPQARAARSASPLAPVEATPPSSPARPEPRIVLEAHSAPAREGSVSFHVSSRTEADDDAALAAMFEPEPSSLQRVATRVLLALRTHGGAALRAAGPLVQGAWHKAGPVVRTLWLRLSALGRSLVVERVGPQLGALRRVLASQFSQRRRRKTTAPASAVAPEERSSLVRTVLLSVMGAAAVAMAVYAFAPAASDEELPLQKPVKRMPGTDAVEQAAAQPADGLGTSASPAAAEPPTTPDPRLMPSASTVPAGSPFAVDVRDGKASGAATPAKASTSTLTSTSAAAPTPARGKALRFGAAQVSNAKRFTLRMSARVTALDGAADAGGFTVVATGGLALDRAGPIKSALPVVTSSMIINKGDRAELTIRFADGKRPAYQVLADGTTLTVVIQDL